MNDFWAGAKKALIDVGLPLAASALAPGVGGPAVKLITKVLGCDSTPEAIEHAIKNATPEQKIALAAEENRHSEELAKISVENNKNYLQDVQNARGREIDFVKVTGKRDVMPPILAIMSVFGFLGMVGFLLVYEPPASNERLLGVLIGIVISQSREVFSYYFGSSKGSSDKTQLINQKNKGV